MPSFVHNVNRRHPVNIAVMCLQVCGRCGLARRYVRIQLPREGVSWAAVRELAGRLVLGQKLHLDNCGRRCRSSPFLSNQTEARDCLRRFRQRLIQIQHAFRRVVVGNAYRELRDLPLNLTCRGPIEAMSARSRIAPDAQ